MLNKEIIVKDSCILFDLIDLDLIELFFQLDLKVLTTPQVIDEIKDEIQFNKIVEYANNNKLVIDGDGTFETIQSIFNECKGLSYTDSSVLELAIRKGGTILSADKSLRNESVRRNLNVRGVLWVIEKLTTTNIITNEIAIRKLKLYPQVNKRVPIKEINVLIEKLSLKLIDSQDGN